MNARRDPDDFDMSGDEWRAAIARARSAEMRTLRQNFYEEDEPVEKIKAAWERGEKGKTAPPHTCGAVTMTSATTCTVTFRDNHLIVSPECPGCQP